MNGEDFSMLAYAGGELDSAYWGKAIIDISGIHFMPKMPILREHDPDRIIGHGAALKRQGGLYVEGTFSQVTQDAKEVQRLSDEGFPWQASIGIWTEEAEQIFAEETVTVNNRPFVGPGIIIRQAYLREASFATLSDDDKTSAKKLAVSAMGSGGMAEKTERETMSKIPLSVRLDQHTFMKKVRKIMNDEKLSKHQAMMRAVKKFPNDHEAFIRLANQG
jgi:hypothetical protein